MLKNPFISGFIAASVIVAILYFNDKYKESSEDNSYLKLFGAIFVIVTALVYYAKSGSFQMTGGSSNYDVYADAPDF